MTAIWMICQGMWRSMECRCRSCRRGNNPVHCTVFVLGASVTIAPSRARRRILTSRYSMNTLDVIKDQISSNNVILYMKGSPQFPQCGFSARAVEALMSVGKPFAYVNILEHPDIRAELPKYANWPTFPQLWVKGELVGGSDIILEMAQKGELKPLIEEAVAE